MGDGTVTSRQITEGLAYLNGVAFSPTPAPLVAEMRAVARAHGYALAVHGSQVRDLDLVAVPWVEGCSDPDALVDAIEERCGVVATQRRAEKPHGRLGYVLHGRKWRGGDDHQPIDLSVVSP